MPTRPSGSLHPAMKRQANEPSRSRLRARFGSAGLGVLILATALQWAACSEQRSEQPASSTQSQRSVPQEPLPRNALVITMDTTRADALGAYGQVLPTSPAIDRMAAEGVLFEQCNTAAPSTLPSHASIFTGKYPFAHGARSNGGYVLSQDNATLAELLQARGYRTAAEIANSVIDERTQLDQGFDSYRGPSAPGVELKTIQIRDEGELRTIERDDRTATDITRAGIEFLRANQREPFFLWLHYFDPHSPYSPPGPFGARIPTSPYHAEVAYTDLQIGLVLRELSKLGLEDRTLVVLTSDHGEGMQDHGELTHTFFVYEATMRVPLIFWGPDALLTNRRVKSLVRTIDIAPTILDFLGLPPLPDAQGQSLMPLLTGKADDLQLTSYGDSIEFVTTFNGDVLRFVREGSWKYIHQPTPALYDLSVDPNELNNVADQHPERVARLQKRLRELIEEAPDAPRDAVQQLDAERRAELIALGYVGADAPTLQGRESESLELRAFDPTTKTEDVALFAAARGRLGQDQPELALEDFERLWERNPSSVPVLTSFVSTLFELGLDERAVPLIEHAVALDPDNPGLFLDLGRMAHRSGHTAEAIVALQKAVAGDPCGTTTRALLAELLRVESRHAERRKLLENGIDACPEAAEFKNDLAWMLATCPDAAWRDGARAVALAKLAVEASPENVGYLDTLAAAHAEAGQYSEAAAVAEGVLQSLEQIGVPEETQAIFREHLARFEAGEPVRDTL